MKVKKYMNNFMWNLDNSDNIGKHIIKGELWEPHLLNFISSFVKSGDFCLDIGACFGWHTLHISRCVGKDGKVFAFEPIQENIELLSENIIDNNITNVTLYDVALGHKYMNVCMCNANSDTSKNSGDAFISMKYDIGVENDINNIEYLTNHGVYLKINKHPVTCKTLDSFTSENKIKFIKLDVQGFERMVIEGAEELIKKDRPIIAVELEDPCMVHYGYSSKELISYIQSLGYYIYFLDFSYPCDHICVPNEQLADFETQFHGKIHSHSINNSINNNYNHGIVKKIVL